MTFISLIFALLLFAINDAEAVNRYVDPVCGAISNYNPTATGSARCSGGAATSRPTIMAAIALSGTTDVVWIRAGTYNEQVMLNDKVGGTNSTNALVIEAYPGTCFTAGVKGPGGGCESVFITGGVGYGATGASRYVTFRGLVFRGASFDMGVYHDPGGTNNITLENSEVDGQLNVESVVFLDGSNNRIINNKLHSNKLGDNCFQAGDYGHYCHGIYNTGLSNNLVQGNEIYDISGTGIHQYSAAGGGHTYRDNVIHNTGQWNGHNDTASAILLMSVDGAKVFNNVLYNNQSGITVVSSTNDIYSNTIWGTGNSGTVPCSSIGCYPAIEVSTNNGPHANNNIRNNIVFNNSLNTIVNPYTGTVSNNLTTNPQFVNAAAFDFRLCESKGVPTAACASASAAINAGANLASPYNVDITGAVRSTNFDIGAYEAGGTAPPVVTITTNSGNNFTTSTQIPATLLQGTASGTGF